MCLPTSEVQTGPLGAGGDAESLLQSMRAAPGPIKQEEGARRAEGEGEPDGGLLSDLREVQCLICCLLHQMFIADPNIAKLVHFQVNTVLLRTSYVFFKIPNGPLAPLSIRLQGLKVSLQI